MRSLRASSARLENFYHTLVPSAGSGRESHMQDGLKTAWGQTIFD